MRRRPAGVALGTLVVILAAFGRTAGADAAGDLPDVHARGTVLGSDGRYVYFVTGDALVIRSGTPLPAGLTLGSTVLVTIDPLACDVTAVVLRAPRVAGEIAIAEVPRRFVVAAPKSARVLAAARERPLGESAATAGLPAPATIVLEVTVPANTPPNDDVYVSTERSTYGAAEVRMQRIDARRFTATVAFDTAGHVRYRYTRGSYATVERDRRGGIVEPRVAERGASKRDDTVTRWADER